MSVETEDYMRQTPTLRIPLTQGKFALIDTTDWYLIAGRPWYAKQRKNDGLFDAVIMEGRRQRKMHEAILGHRWVDHRDMNPLNNRRENLRPCTNTENIRNRPAVRGSRFPYKGVSYYPRNGKYRAAICHNDLDRHLGYFDNPISAAMAYDRAATIYHQDFARLNFPKE